MATPLRDFAIPQRFLAQMSRAETLVDIGLNAQDISRAVVEHIAALESTLAVPNGAEAQESKDAPREG